MNPDRHLTADEAKGFAALAPVGRLAVSDHLAACADCRSLVATLRVPPGDVQRTLKTEVQRIHAAIEDYNTRDAEERQGFARRMETFPAEHFEPGDTLPVSAAKPVRHPASGPRWWQILFSPVSFAGAGITLAALVAIVSVTAFHHRKNAAPPPQVASARPLLNDGPLQVAADGRLQTSADFPADLRAAILLAVQERTLRVPGEMLGAMRGTTDSPIPAVNPPPPPFPVQPAPGSTVETQRPLLRWTGVTGAAGYRVEVRSLSTGETVSSPPLPPSQTQWQPGQPLERGRIYRWSLTVSPVPDNAVTASASLKILSAADEENLRQLRVAPQVSHLALAAACARFNLATEARQELDALSAENPHSALATQLRASLK